MKSWEDSVQELKADPSKKELVRACFFDDPIEESLKRYYDSSEWKAIRAVIPRAAGRAIDIGAGRGIVSYALAQDGWKVTALEPDSSKIVGAGAIREISSRFGLPIEVIEDWGERLPFHDNQFDLVICRQVLHHARDLSKFCAEASRIMKQGGLFLGIREHVIDGPESLRQFLAAHPLHQAYGGENAFRLDEYTSAIEGSGLRIISQLNPFQSDINLYPLTKEDVKRRWANKLRLPISGLIPDAVLSLRGRAVRNPGRLYSFVAVKSAR